MDGAMRHDGVIFDLGNTLVSYYTREQWPAILEEAIASVSACLRERGTAVPKAAEVARRIQAENHESQDYRVRPLEERLARIFGLTPADTGQPELMTLCRCFLAPIFALARRYDDALPVLAELRRRGLRTGILSNTPWGSPAGPWREELDRHGLLTTVDEVVFCRDVGYRKPARRPFDYILARLGVPVNKALFVGDDPRWDIAGPRAIGMDAVLIDRTGTQAPAGVETIRTLTKLLDS